MDFGKAKTKEAALSSYRTYYSNVPQNLPINAFVALQNLSKNKDLIFQKSDNDNSVVIGDRQDYRKKMNNVLSDQKKNYHSKFERRHFTELCCQPRKTR